MTWEQKTSAVLAVAAVLCFHPVQSYIRPVADQKIVAAWIHLLTPHRQAHCHLRFLQCCQTPRPSDTVVPGTAAATSADQFPSWMMIVMKTKTADRIRHRYYQVPYL